MLNQVQPKAIICLGERVLTYVQARFGGGKARVFRIGDGGALVVCIPHPGNEEVTDKGRDFCIRAAVKEIRAALEVAKGSGASGCAPGAKG